MKYDKESGKFYKEVEVSERDYFDKDGNVKDEASYQTFLAQKTQLEKEAKEEEVSKEQPQKDLRSKHWLNSLYYPNDKRFYEDMQSKGIELTEKEKQLYDSLKR